MSGSLWYHLGVSVVWVALWSKPAEIRRRLRAIYRKSNPRNTLLLYVKPEDVT